MVVVHGSGVPITRDPSAVDYAQQTYNFVGLLQAVICQLEYFWKVALDPEHDATNYSATQASAGRLLGVASLSWAPESFSLVDCGADLHRVQGSHGYDPCLVPSCTAVVMSIIPMRVALLHTNVNEQPMGLDDCRSLFERIEAWRI